jgi:hypothetical protein
MTPATLARHYRAGPLVAYHEAAHAVVAYRLGRRVERVGLGYARDSGQTDIQPTWDPRERALICLAGERGERRSVSWLDSFEGLQSSSEDRRGFEAALAELGPGWSEAMLTAEVDGLLADRGWRLDELARRLDSERVLDGPVVARLLG